MAINEQIVTGRAKRVLIDKAAKLWQRISEWTKASDVEFNDAKTAETKVGAIDGITDSLASNSSRIAASAKAVSSLNNNLGGLQFYEDTAGNKYVVGADSVPKKLGSANLKISVQTDSGWLYADQAAAMISGTITLNVIDGVLNSTGTIKLSVMDVMHNRDNYANLKIKASLIQSS